MDPLSSTFAALADPTRRAILARLSRGEAHVGELARPFRISAPAVSRHLRVLEQAGLIERQVDAQRRVCRVREQSLREVHDWLEQYRRFWEESLDRLADYVEQQTQKPQPPQTTPTEKTLNTPPTSFALEMSRHFRAPRAKVFDAFVTEEAMRIWKCPRGMSVAESSVDARVGGRWRIAMLARDGSRFVVGGQYREMVRPERLAFTWQWEGDHMPNVETLVEVSFTEGDGGTRMHMRHSGFPVQAMCDAHAQGWRSTFNKLTDLLDERGTAASLVLLGDVRSTYTRTARMGLAEKGVAYTLQNAAPHSPDILAVHPFGRIPAFKDGDIEIFETSAILRYVDECFDGPALLPTTIMGRTRCDQWVSAVNSYFYDTMVRRYLLQYIFPKGANGQPDRAVIDKALGEMPAQIAALDKAYAASDFLAGPTLSVADLFVAPIVAYLATMPEGAQLLATAPNLQRAQAVMAARPSFTTTQPQLS